MASWRSFRRKPLALEQPLSQKPSSIGSQRWQFPNRTPIVDSHGPRSGGVVEQGISTSLSLPKSGAMRPSSEMNVGAASQGLRAPLRPLDNRPLSQPSQSQFSGMASESQHFALPPLRSSQLPNLQQLTQAHPVCGIPPSQLMQGSQATCINAPLLASTSQPQSQMNLNDLHNPPPAPCVEGSRPKPAATPCTFDTQLQSCRQMQIKGSSAPGLSVRPSPVAVQLLKQVTTVSSHDEVSKEVLAKVADLQQQCSGLQTILVEIHQQSQPYLKIEASITGIHNEITNLKEMVLELKAEAEKPRTSVAVAKSTRDQATSMEAWQNISERDGMETATSEDVTRSEIVPPSPVFASRAVDQSRNMKEPPSDVVKPNRLPEMIQARQVPQNRVFSLKRGRACAPKDPRPCPSKHAAGASPAREEDSQPGVASSPLQMIQKLHPHQQACAEDFGSPSSDHLSSSIGLFTMLSNNPQRSRAVDAQPRQPSIDKDAVQHRPTKRLRQMASQDIQKATRCDVQVQTRKSEAPKGKEGKQVQARTPYNFRSREGGPRLQWRYSPGNDGHSSQQKKTAEKDDGKKRGSRPGQREEPRPRKQEKGPAIHGLQAGKHVMPPSGSRPPPLRLPSSPEMPAIDDAELQRLIQARLRRHRLKMLG